MNRAKSMVSDLLPIQSVNNVDVVDSRLIAIELGIQHESFLKTIRKYQTRLEKRGHLRFEIETVQNSVGAKNEVIYYWLNERQCIFLTTLSRNTEQVVELKDKIEESFYQAKKHLFAQQDEIETLKLKLKVLEAEKDVALAQQKLLDTRHMVVTTCPEVMQQKILGYQIVEKPVIEKVVYREDEFIRDNSTLNKTQLCKRYGILTRNGKPDYPRLNKLMATLNLPKDAWREIKNIQPTEEFNKDYLTLLDRLMIDDSRQLWIAEAS